LNKIEQTHLNFILVVSAVVALYLISQNWKKQLTLDNVVVYDTNILTVDEIKSLADLQHGVPLFMVNLADVSKRVEQNPFVKNAVVVRALPYDVTITVHERNPIALVAMSGRVLCVDEKGVVLPLPLGRRSDLPVITNCGDNYGVGDTVSGALMQAVKFLTDAKGFNPSVSAGISEISLQGGEITAYTTATSLPILIGMNNFERKLLYLQEFFSKIASNGNLDCTYVDLRYNGQIVLGTERPGRIETVSSNVKGFQTAGSPRNEN